MKWLSRLGYIGLSLREIHPYILGQKRGKVVGITFDDGFCNVHENALSVLRDLGFSSTCFFVSGQIGGFNKWDEPKGIPYTRCMSDEKIREWANAGNEIGAHTVDHVHLTEVGLSEAFDQISNSRKRLEEISNQRVTSFSYPYGDVSPDIRNIVERSGFKLAVTLRKAQASSRHDPLLLPRRNIRHSDGWIAACRKTIFG
ncbi:polysaccharide deacetylase family protein [Phyllobacterium phragmitis]|nr:polysaccharide deacetylase family protein [Phyllobacterium phragmitis]